MNKRLFDAVIAAALLLLVFRLSPSLRVEALLPALQLTLAAAALTAAGSAAAAVVGLPDRWFRTPPLLMGLAQLWLTAYVYVRSLAAQALASATGYPLQFSSLEVWLVVAAALAFISRRNAANVTARMVNAVGAARRFAPLACAIFFVVASRELPRELMLSSDPDQHSFFAHQIAKLGAVPFNQGMWGPEDLGYPAGFAALTVIWSSLSFLNIGDALTVQPMLQTILSVLALVWLLPELSRATDLHRLKLSASIALLTAYFTIWPHTLEPNYYHLEGTGRISILLLTITTLVLCAELFARLSARRKPGLISVTLGLGVANAALINPVNVVVPGAIGACAFAAGWLRRPGQFVAIAKGALLAAASSAALLLAEPYYFFQFTPAHVPSRPAAASHAMLPDIVSRLSELSSSLETFISYYRLSCFGDPTTGWILPVVLIGLLWILQLLPRARLPSWFGITLTILPVLIGLIRTCFEPIFHGVREIGVLYLLAPYFSVVLLQLQFLWLMALLAAVMVQVGTLQRWAPAEVAACAAVLLFPLASYRDEIGVYNLAPRYNYCGSMGCVTDDDRNVMREIERKFEEYRAAGRPLSFNEVPKILIPNHHFVSGPERWLMPYGASRALPAYDTFPLAFFYFQGSSDYSYDNYLANVCRRLNLQWLKERNIRFAFIPAQNPGTCLRRLPQLSRADRVVFSSGKALFVRLF